MVTSAENERKAAVAIRPVQLLNAVGQALDQAVDPFWSAICRETRAFSVLVRGGAFQRAACTDAMHRIFLHQAVLSGVPLARMTPAERRWLPLATGHPLDLHERVPEAVRARALEELTVALYESLWDENPGWMRTVGAAEPLASWVRDAQRRLLRVTDRIYREEGSCNSYLVLAAGGSVIVGPGGTERRDSVLRAMAGDTHRPGGGAAGQLGRKISGCSVGEASSASRPARWPAPCAPARKPRRGSRPSTRRARPPR